MKLPSLITQGFRVLALSALTGCLVTTPTSSNGQQAVTPEAAVQKISPDDPNIQYVGRIDFKNPQAPAFSYPGLQILARFEGSSLDVILSDTGDQNHFDVSVDNLDALVIQTSPGRKTYRIARNLGEGSHTVRIYKRTESSCGTTTFLGFKLDQGKQLVAADPPPTRKIEFVGDSITCGYGNMVSTDQPENFHFTPRNENNAQSWGALTARNLNAQFMSTSYSGRGMFRNIDASETGLLPSLYKVIFADNPGRAAWDANRYHPDVIVINLGTNDYSSLLTKNDLSHEEFDARFATAYREFIQTLRKLHGPRVKIVCAVGPMLNDSYPQGQESWTRIQTTVSGLVKSLKDAGDAEVYYLRLDPQESPFGEDWHPSLATHRIMADQATRKIRDITGW